VRPSDQDLAVGLGLAKDLFDIVGAEAFDGTGFTRAAYGEGEQRAHDTLSKAARSLNLDIEIDAALNMSMTLKGRDSDAGALLIGSHLDAVPNGGNYDGLAGVLSGFACVAALHSADIQPARDISILAIRSEESAWFAAQHIGSRSMLGTLDESVLDTATRVDSGKTLRFHMEEAGADLSKIGLGKPLRDVSAIFGYIELHIEQGPILLAADMPVGVVTGIRGNRRCRKVLCTGKYGHSGTVARSDRHDAVFAVSELITRMDDLWRVIEDEDNGDLVLTFGSFSTDPAAHAVTKVPGLVEFCFDARSHSADVLNRVEAALFATMDDIATRRSVTFSHDPLTGDIPATMDPGFQDLLKRGCTELHFPTMPITSGAGHDAGDFALAGVPSAMLFIRSENGSHNPNEYMEIDDFNVGTRLISWFANEIN
jgi:N-carbamoyl-L-amino-acid hydrolase